MVSKIGLLICSVFMLLVVGCETGKTSGPNNGFSAGIEAPGEGVISDDPGIYTLQPLDPLYIRFSGIQEQLQLELVIDGQGEISLLHIEKPIKAAGLTTSQLESLIEQLYVDGGIYKNVSVNVTMTAKNFYIQGEVNQPGQFPLQSGTTLIQAIAGARGYTAFAEKKKVTITRSQRVTTFNMKELEKDPTKDVKINAGDVIKVYQKKW